MINPDINRFLGTLLYPVTDAGLLFNDPFEPFFDQLPSKFILPNKNKLLQNNKGNVFDTAVKYIARRYSVDSYDQIFQYIERWYLGQSVWRHSGGEQREPYSLYDVVFRRLDQLSRSMISKLDGQIIYKYWQTEEDAVLLGGFAGNDKIHLFRGLNQIIPLDLLAAIFVMGNPDAETALNSFYGQVSITDAPLERILSQGVAENHLHMGAATGFSVIWEDLMRPNISLAGREKELPLRSPDAPSRPVLYFYWLMARFLRMYLAVCVPACGGADTGSCVRDVPGVPDRFLDHLKRLYEISCGNGGDTDSILEFFRPLEEKFSAAVMDDPASLLWPKTPVPLTEPRFLFHLFTVFSMPGAHDLAFPKKLFLQYLRIKHTIFHLMVQNKTISGLDHFQLYYGSASKFNQTAASGRSIFRKSEEWMERQIRSQLSTPHIRRLEFRVSFFDRKKNAREFLAQFLRAYQKILHGDYCVFDPKSETYRPVQPLPRVGIVFHFLKSNKEAPDVCFYSGDETLRMYSELHAQYRRQLEIFKELRDPRRYPGIDRYLVGIDAASLESSVPTWVFRDIYENARDAKSEPFALAGAGRRPFQSLGFTFHAGEDFRHLLSGLRRVYEVVCFLKFHAGDRLGHGLALGVLADDWCAAHPNVLLPRIEALENYLWAYRMLSTYPSSQNTGSLLYLEQQIQRLSDEIFRVPEVQGGTASSIPTSVLLQGYEELFRAELFSADYEKCADDRCKLEGQELCPLLKAVPSSAKDILKAYHCFHYTRRMNEPIHYHLPPQEILILKELQAMLQEYVSRQGVIVEANPSSNVVIGHIDTIHEHPLYQFSSYRCDYKDIMVCINSDDPSVFQTNTANELGIAYMGMVERGVGREACLEWIERLRKNGMNGSFIRRTDSDAELLKELDELLKAF